MFVLVPSTSVATVESIKTASLTTNKIYFMAKYNQIVAKGTVYGVDPSTGKELESLVTVLGGTKGPDGTVTVDFKNLNYYTSEGTKTIIGAIGALDAKIKDEMTKLAASKTLNENYEFTGQIKYVEAKNGVEAHIALVKEDGTELSTIPVSKIIGNGVLKTSTYDAATGILTLTFAQASGVDKAIEVDLKAMLDINDISIAEASKKYLEVTLGTAGTEGDTQAVFGAKIVKPAEASATNTGLVDAWDVKQYINGQTSDLAVTAEGDAHVSATVNADTDKRHVIVHTNVQNVAADAGTRGKWSVSDTGVATLSGETAPSISGVANSLIDGAQGVEAVQTYVDAKVAAEAAERGAKISAAIKALDKPSGTVNGTNVHVTYKEEDGIVTIESVTEDYATVTYESTSSFPLDPIENASITVPEGDKEKLVKAKDLKAVADYAADKVTEETHRVDNKIADLGGSATSDEVAGVTTTVTTSGGQVSGVVVTVADNAVAAGGTKGSRTLTVGSTDNVIKGQAIAQIKDYVDNVVADNTTDLAVKAEGDKYITAAVDSTDNKKIKITADVTKLTVETPASANSTLTGTADSLVDAADVASKVSSFVNKRIDEEIKKLDVTEKTIGDSNVEIKYSETDGKIAASAAIKYATVNYNKVGEAAATLTVTDGGQLAKGNDINSLKQYVDSHVAEAVNALDSSVEKKDASNLVTVKTVIADGKLDATNSSVAVVYASNTSAGKYSNGVATGDFVNAVLGDLWETYVDA